MLLYNRMHRTDQGYDYFYLNDCSGPVEALDASEAILSDYAKQGVTDLEMDGARGAVCYSLCERMDDIVADGLSRMVDDKPLDESHQLLRELANVTREEVEMCIREELSKLFEVSKTCGVLTCPEDKVEEYEEELKDLGYTTKVLSYAELLQDGFN